MAYRLEEKLLQVCTCNILCPCWVGEKPDGDGTCKAEYYRAREPRLGFDIDLRGHNAIQGEFTFVG